MLNWKGHKYLGICIAMSGVGLCSCSTVKEITQAAYRGSSALVRGVVRSLPGVGEAVEKIDESYDEAAAREIAEMQQRLEDARYQDVQENRAEFVGVIQEMSRFILQKAAGDPEKNIPGDNFEYIVPTMEKEFLRTEQGKKYGGRKKDAVRVLVESFKIMTHYFSDVASKAFFEKAATSWRLCLNFHILREKDDALVRKKAMIDNARMINFEMDVSSDVMTQERLLHYAKQGQDALNLVRGKERE